MKEQKGITLIALIITIIVMLILVGVTINVALNGGIFEKAQDAKQKTSREVAREELLSIVTGTLNNTGDLQITPTNLAKDEWTAEQSENENYLKCTSPKDEVFYVNTKTGAILDKLSESSEDTYYNISFKDLSKVDLSTLVSQDDYYLIGFQNKNGTYSGIQFISEKGVYLVILFPNVADSACYTYEYQSSTGTTTPWEYSSGEAKNPPDIESAKIDYTAGSQQGVSDFTENMINSILDITEIK